jgi:hypothetical protein
MRRKSSDPLAHLLARKRIDRQQYLAGREYRKHARAGTEAWLQKCHMELGQDGTALVDSMLIEGRTAKEVAAAHGKLGQAWESYYSRRLGECLNTLAEVFGFANGQEAPQEAPGKPGPRTALSGLFDAGVPLGQRLRGPVPHPDGKHGQCDNKAAEHGEQ